MPLSFSSASAVHMFDQLTEGYEQPRNRISPAERMRLCVPRGDQETKEQEQRARANSLTRAEGKRETGCESEGVGQEAGGTALRFLKEQQRESEKCSAQAPKK